MGFQKDLLAEYDREIAKSRKMLEAIPEDVDFTQQAAPQIDGPRPPGRAPDRHERRLGDAHHHPGQA